MQTFVCIHCPDPYFVLGRGTGKALGFYNKSDSVATTDDEKSSFFEHCARKAFDKPGTAQASVKAEYECTKEDDDDVRNSGFTITF